LSLNVIKDFPVQFSKELLGKLSMLTDKILCDHKKNNFEINLKFVSSEEMIILNKTFRKKSADTNVLAFPADSEIMQLTKELGDIAISVPFTESEAKTLNRDLDDHMMHLVAHGVLHLLGFDHIKQKDANLMEFHEISYLKKFNIANPY
jgi:probable rRNA maturation factor